MKQKHLIALVTFVVIFIGMQSAAISLRSYWEDETWTVTHAEQGPQHMLEAVSKDFHGPLYDILLSYWGMIFGFHEPGAKSFSVLWLVLALLLVYQLGKKWFSPQAGLIAAGIFSLSTIPLTWGHTVRYYSLGAFWSVLAVLGMEYYLSNGRLRWLGVYALAGAGLLYTVYQGAPLLVVLNLLFLIQWRRQQGTWLRFFAWLVAQVIVMAAFYPWLKFLSVVAEENFQSIPAFAQWPLEIGLRGAYLFFAFSIGEFLSPINPVAWIGLGVTSGLAVYSLFRRPKNYWQPLFIFILGGLASILISMTSKYPNSIWHAITNRSFFLFPFFVLWMASAIEGVPLKKLKTILVVTLLGVYLLGDVNYFLDREVSKPILIVPWNQIMQRIQASPEGDKVVFCSIGDTACKFYANWYQLPLKGFSEWKGLSQEPPQELWWIQTNLGEERVSEVQDRVYQEIMADYELAESMNFARQDPALGRIKSLLSDYQDYEYRLTLQRFRRAGQP